MKRIILLFLIVTMAIFITSTTVYADNKKEAPFTSGYLPDGEIYLKLQSGFDFINQSSETLNWELALTGAVLSKEVYDFPESDPVNKEVYDFSESDLVNEDANDFSSNKKEEQKEKARSTIQPVLINLGYTQTSYYYYPDHLISSVKHPACCFGYKRIENKNGKAKNVFAIVVRGTHSVTDIVTDIESGGKEFFALAINSVCADFVVYAENVTGKKVNELQKEDNYFFITGHSLGGAIANGLSVADTILNLAGRDKNKIYTYTFEAPHTCTNNWLINTVAAPYFLLAAPYNYMKNWLINPKKVSNAFNFKDVDDAVPNLPPWASATRFGTDFEFSVKDLDNDIFTTLFPKAKGGSVIEAPKIDNYGALFGIFNIGHHDMGLPLTYILQNGIREKTWESVEDVLQVSGNELESKDSETDNKIVPVKRIRYDAHGEEVLCVEYEYNVAGEMVREKDYDFAGVSDGSRDIEYEYDDSGNLTKEIYYNVYNDDGSINYDAYKLDENIIWWKEYEYDSAGNEIKATCYAYDGSVFDWGEYEYDNAGNMIKRVWYNNGRCVWHEYEYNDVGKKIKEISYNEDGSVSKWQESEYDSMGNEVKTISYNGDGSVGDWEEYEYDAVGNQTTYILYMYGKVNYKKESKYDSTGNKIMDISYNYNIYGDLFGWNETEYDGNGNEIKQTNYNADGSIDYWEEYQYESLATIRNSSRNLENQEEYR